jgi:hypothetical protein
MRRLWLIACVSVLTLALAGTAVAGATVYFRGAVNQPRVQPKSLYLTGDGTLYVGNMVWSKWGGRTARGLGLAEYHGCKPSCAAAKVRHARVHAQLTRIRSCHGKRFYTRVVLRKRNGGLLDARYLNGQDWSPCHN